MKIRKVGCVVLFVPFFPWRAVWHLWQMTACWKQPAARMCPQAVSQRRWLVPPLISLSCCAALPHVVPDQSGWVPENIWGGENILYPTIPCSLAMTLLHSLSTPRPPASFCLAGGWRQPGMLQGRQLPAVWQGLTALPRPAQHWMRRWERHEVTWTTSVLPPVYKDQNDNNKDRSTSFWFLKRLNFTENYPQLPFSPSLLLFFHFSLPPPSSKLHQPEVISLHRIYLPVTSAEEKPRLHEFDTAHTS